MSALGTTETTRELVPYWRAKWQMEQDVAASGLEHVILRPSFVFGKDGGVLPTFVRQVRYSPVVTVLGPGTARLQPIWVGDVAAHFARAVYLADAANRTFELGGPTSSAGTSSTAGSRTCSTSAASSSTCRSRSRARAPG